jgi:hypothetical protein
MKLSENFYHPWVTEKTIGFVINDGEFFGVGILIPIDKIITDQRKNEVLFDFHVWRNLLSVPVEKLETEEFRAIVADVLNDMMEKIAQEATNNEAREAKPYEPEQTPEQAQELISNLFEEISQLPSVTHHIIQ